MFNFNKPYMKLHGKETLLFDKAQASLRDCLNHCYTRGINFLVEWQNNGNDVCLVTIYKPTLYIYQHYCDKILHPLELENYEKNKKNEKRPQGSQFIKNLPN